jgi:hypothetical protein
MHPVDATRDSVARHFHAAVLLIVAVYATLQLTYIVHLPLVMDEFDGAYEAFHLRHAVPYRDFIPYKTVLGYYIQTAATFAANEVWPRILLLKGELAFINVAMLVAAAAAMARMRSRAAVVAALALLVFCSTFLERSSELRVDMLTAWAGLWSLILLLRGRAGWAGALAGLSFLVSQKGAFYIVAGGIALFVQWVMQARNADGLKPIFRYFGATCAAIGFYIAAWGAATSFPVVLDATFGGGARAALVHVYDIRQRYWLQVLRRDPGYFLVTAVALWKTASRRSIIVFVYSAILLCEAIAYSQPWPYFFVILFPTLFVLHAVFLDEVVWTKPVALAIVLGAIVLPLWRVPVVLQRHNDYQRHTVEVAAALLEPSDVYLAGTDMIHDREQWPSSLARLGAPVILDLKMRPFSSIVPILDDLRRRSPKVIIGSYRIYSLPAPILSWIGQNYSRATASVFVYAPFVSSGAVTLAFSGSYRIDMLHQGSLRIDGAVHSAGEEIALGAGMHHLEVSGPTRLRLIPPRLNAMLDPEFLDEQNLYPNVYDY